jgi:flagellar motor switch protein FliN/FliY
MSSLSPDIIDSVVAACQAGAAEAADAFGRCLGAAYSLADVVPGAYSATDPDAGFDGPGLVVLLSCGAESLAICLPESSDMLPPWYGAPGVTDASKLQTLAQELSMLLLPETLAADKFDAQRVESLAAALTRGGAAAEAAQVAIQVASGDQSSQLTLVWPLSSPATVFEGVIGAAAAKSQVDAKTSPAKGGAQASAKPKNFSQLPSYSRTLLKVRLTLSVHLATKKETVKDVVELVPGSIIKFDKGCDELLRLVVGGQPIAEGEAVKVGDKFGFRVTSMVLPKEHFVPVRRPKAS